MVGDSFREIPTEVPERADEPARRAQPTETYREARR